MTEQTATLNTLNSRVRLLWTWTGWALIISVVALSLVPLTQQIDIDHFDKLEHSLAYAILMLWFAQVYPKKRWIWIAIGFSSMGIVLEFLQSQTGYRSFSYGDMVANALGTFGGWFLAVIGWSTLLTTLEMRFNSKDTQV